MMKLLLKLFVIWWILFAMVWLYLLSPVLFGERVVGTVVDIQEVLIARHIRDSPVITYTCAGTEYTWRYFAGYTPAFLTKWDTIWIYCMPAFANFILFDAIRDKYMGLFMMIPLFLLSISYQKIAEKLGRLQEDFDMRRPSQESIAQIRKDAFIRKRKNITVVFLSLSLLLVVPFYVSAFQNWMIVSSGELIQWELQYDHTRIISSNHNRRHDVPIAYVCGWKEYTGTVRYGSKDSIPPSWSNAEIYCDPLNPKKIIHNSWGVKYGDFSMGTFMLIVFIVFPLYMIRRNPDGIFHA